LLLKAAQEHNIDLKNSLMVGDSQTDILAAKNVGCSSILLKKNQRLIDVIREFVS
jgi:D-glycero-D-manno-heptose 1,7-bisphosphate phosphatase